MKFGSQEGRFYIWKQKMFLFTVVGDSKMPARRFALINPEILIWARDSLGLSLEQASSFLKLTPEKLQSLESGDRYPSISELKKIAKKYKRPFSAFYLSGVPEKMKQASDHRSLAYRAYDEYNKDIYIEFRKAVNRRESLLELLSIEGEEDIEFNLEINRNSDPSREADRIRNIMSISIEEQFGFKSSRVAFNEWRKKLENSGILAFQFRDIPVFVLRGFSYYYNRYPIIANNIKDSYNGRIFTLFHELAHIMLHNSGLCDFNDGTSVESYCNKFAASFLVPKDVILALPEFRSLVDESSFESSVDDLSKKFSVSKYVVLLRAFELGVISRRILNSKLEGYELAYSDYTEEERKKGFATPDKISVATSGNYYIQRVLSAYYSNNISLRAVSDLLDVKVRHINNIERSVWA